MGGCRDTIKPKDPLSREYEPEASDLPDRVSEALGRDLRKSDWKGLPEGRSGASEKVGEPAGPGQLDTFCFQRKGLEKGWKSPTLGVGVGESWLCRGEEVRLRDVSWGESIGERVGA